MPRISYDGQTRVGFVVSITNPNAPTVVELNTATSLSPFLKRDGMDFPAEQNMVENSDITTSQNFEGVGTEKYGPITFKLYRDTVDADDDAWNLFSRNLSGFIVRRELISVDTAWAAGQKLHVYSVTSHEPAPSPFGTDTMITADVKLAVSGKTFLRAVVAA